MSGLKKTLMIWYRSNNFFKRFVAFFIGSPYILFTCSFKENIYSAKKRSKRMKELGSVKNQTLTFLDMLFYYLFFGYFPSTYASYHFELLSFKQRLSFMPSVEHGLFSKSLNVEGDISILQNKGKTYEYLKEFFGREQLIIKTKDDFQAFANFVAKHKKFFYKPTNGICGKGAGLANSDEIDLKEFFDELISQDSYVIEELIVECKELALFHPSSVNTIRIATFKTKKGTEILFAGLRCGQGGSIVDNGGADGIFIPINLETGRLIKYGFDEYGNKFTMHPNTKMVFEGFQIPRYDELRSFIIKAADTIPGFRYVGWDIAITEDKFMLIEGNDWPGHTMLQGLHKTGFKKEFREMARTGLIPESFRNKQKEIYNA